MRGTIEEGNGDAPVVVEHNGEGGTFIEKLSNFLAGIRSSVRNDPPRRRKKGKRDANRLTERSHRPQGDQVVSVAMLGIIHKLLSASVKDGEMRSGEVPDPLSEKKRPLAPGLQEGDVQIWTKNLKRDSGKASSGTDVKKGERLVGRKPGQCGKRVEHVPGHEAREIVRSHEINPRAPRADGVEMKKQIAKLCIAHGAAKRSASVSKR